MAKTLTARVADDETPKKPSIAATHRVGVNVLKALGQPHNLLRIQVKSLWGDHFRVNVFTGTPESAAVSHSFFLEASTDGEILKSSPPIERAYPAA